MHLIRRGRRLASVSGQHPQLQLAGVRAVGGGFLKRHLQGGTRDVLVTKRQQRTRENAAKKTLRCSDGVVFNAIDERQRVDRQLQGQQFASLIHAVAQTDLGVLA